TWNADSGSGRGARRWTCPASSRSRASGAWRIGNSVSAGQKRGIAHRGALRKGGVPVSAPLVNSTVAPEPSGSAVPAPRTPGPAQATARSLLLQRRTWLGHGGGGRDGRAASAPARAVAGLRPRSFDGRARGADAHEAPRALA